MKLDNFGRSSFVIYVIVALVGAAVLVLYLHHRAIAMFERQTELVFQKVSEVTGERLVSQIQNTFEGSVLDTLWAPERPYGRLGNVIKAGRIDILERRYAEGLTRYPQIERFFLWSSPRHGLPGMGGMLFYGGAAERQATFKSFYHDPALGQVIAELAHQYADGSQEFVAAERTGLEGLLRDRSDSSFCRWREHRHLVPHRQRRRLARVGDSVRHPA